MQFERLAKLAELLENLPVIPSDHDSDVPMEFKLKSWHCGTAACACGFASLDPWFNAQGFILHETEEVPVFGTSWGFDAVCEFFDLSNFTSEFLFHWSNYPNGNATEASDVAERIRAFIERENN